MPVLTRRLDPDDPDKAAITIGQDIEVTLVDVRGDQVRIAVSAPRDVPVHRKEIWLQIQQEGRGTA